ncbi:MAG: MG2 domain-containing protein [Syntrophobacteraceae bacterium]|nr:MG2 domain-containing protein [Syntrophobacteraceae bacterium]
MDVRKSSGKRSSSGWVTSVCALLIGFFTVLGLCIAGSFSAVEAAAPKPLKIIRITPSGNDVAPGRQIVFEFDRPVVPLGAMERKSSEIPISITPSLACQWRWLNPSSLACQLDERHMLAAATRYTITVAPGIKAEDGGVLAAPLVHTFITKRPETTYAWFESWLSPVRPVVRVGFDQPVRQDSLEAHAFFKTGAGARIGVKAREGSQAGSQEKPGLKWLLTPAADLPRGKEASLVIEPGILAVTGAEPGVENRSILTLRTLGQFRFAGLRCSNKRGATFILAPQSRLPHVRCNPAGNVSLLFTSPVDTSELKKNFSITLRAKKTGGGAKNETANVLPQDSGGSPLQAQPEKDGYYTFDLQALKPFRVYHLHAEAKRLKDAFGRAIARATDMSFATDHWPSELSLYKDMSVLEKGLDTDLPVFATNIEGVDFSHQAFTTAGLTPVESTVIAGPKAKDVMSAIPLRIRKFIPEQSGVLTGTVSARPPIFLNGEKQPPDFLFAEVTPFHVHLKMGHSNSLAWVTDMKTGLPVPGVSVEIRKDFYKAPGTRPQSLGKAVTDANGLAELPGTSAIDPKLKLAEGYNQKGDERLFVLCQKDKDMALLPLLYHFRVDSEGANYEYIPSTMRSRHGHVRAWGATAQGVYKLGDTVQYKIYVRDEKTRKFILPPEGTYSLKVVDPGSRVVFQRDKIKLSDFGALDGEFLVPKNGAVGYYSFQLKPDFADLDLQPLLFLVSDFTPSPFHVSTDLNGKSFLAGDSVTVSTQAKLHAGGPYGGAPLSVTASVVAHPFEPQDPLARGFEFDVVEKNDKGGSQESLPEAQTVFKTKGKLDNNGVSDTSFTLPQLPVYCGRLAVESSVKDERGKSVASRATAAYFGRDRFVGLHLASWVLEEGKPAKVFFLVADQTGKTVPDQSVHIDIERLEIKAARVKDAGATYPTRYVEEWLPVETRDLTSAAAPQDFEFTPKTSGTVRVTATVTDSKGRIQKSAVSSWVSGQSYVLWKSEEGNLLNIYPDKQIYHVGDTARILVQNPFPGAKALVTIERYGVLDHWVKTLKRSAEVIEIPVLPDYLPGFYVSVVVMSPRVEKPPGPSGEDLGKPAFRIGYARLKVKDRYKEIAVKCISDKPVYKPRDTVKLQFETRVPNVSPGQSSPPVELAVAVLDESVFDLLREKSKAFDPYEGFYKLDDLDLVNYNLLMQLVGREKLEKKGGPPAASAGFDLGIRSVFKFVSYWNPSIRVDSQGKASVEFKAPDNLTGWRVLAMAVSPGDRMGLGQYSFTVNQMTEIRPVLPNQVIEGDSFEAGFSVMNRTDKARNIEVSVAAQGPVESAGESKTSVTQTIAAEPYKRYTVRLPVKASGPGEIIFTAKAGDSLDHDGLRQTLKVLPLIDRSVSAAYGTIQSGEASQSIEFPKGMRPGSGVLTAALSPSILGGLEGPINFMKVYPYECWEQKISRAVMAGAAASLAPYFSSSFSWKNAPAEAKSVLAAAAEFQAPNGGMAFYEPRDEYVSPFLSAFTAKAFNWLKESGYPPPVPVEQRLDKYLFDLLKRDQPRDVESRSVVSDVRALALSALADNGKVTRADLDRSYMHRKEMSLFGRAMLLEALTKVAGTEEMRAKVVQSILARSDQGSGTISFTEEPDSALFSILSSPTRDKGAILMAFLSERAKNKTDNLGDIPLKLMETIASSRKGKTHWDSTQENVFAAMAAVRFSKAFETQKPKIDFRVLFNQAPLGQGSFTNFSDHPVAYDYRAKDSDPGKKSVVTFHREGVGRLYYDTALSYEPVEMSPKSIDAGIEIHRQYSVERDGKWVLAANPIEVKPGDLVRVDLFVSIPSERYFVVVEDPVPGGLEPVNRQLATTSEVDAQKAGAKFAPDSLRARYSDWRDFGDSRWSFYHKELRHSAVRFYSERLDAGHYYLSYVAQAIAGGEFSAPPAHAEEMYQTEVYGKSAPAKLKVDLSK